jgi:DNA-directed RNA polymerase specialized sigma24 family protein
MLELPGRQRDIVILRHLAGFSIIEVADALACAPGTVKTTVAQAVCRLRESFEPRAVNALAVSSQQAERDPESQNPTLGVE